MIGHDVKMPKNEDLLKIFDELLKADGLSLEHFRDQSGVAATSASGSYRRIVTVPDQVQYDIIEMQFENEDLLTFDYLSQPDPTPQIVRPGESTDTKLAPITKALRIRFNLKTSSYATMLLREITRMSSAFSAQYNLSKATINTSNEPSKDVKTEQKEEI